MSSSLKWDQPMKEILEDARRRGHELTEFDPAHPEVLPADQDYRGIAKCTRCSADLRVRWFIDPRNLEQFEPGERTLSIVGGLLYERCISRKQAA